MLKNNKVKKRKIGSEDKRVKNKSNLEFIKNPTTDDQTPKSVVRLKENFGGAIAKFRCFLAITKFKYIEFLKE